MSGEGEKLGATATSDRPQAAHGSPPSAPQRLQQRLRQRVRGAAYVQEAGLHLAGPRVVIATNRGAAVASRRDKATATARASPNLHAQAHLPDDPAHNAFPKYHT